jgi:tetraacyldisaccharide 4'-kinase
MSAAEQNRERNWDAASLHPEWIIGLMSGQRQGISAGLARGLLRAAEPVYAQIMRMRNHLYDSGALRARRLPIAVISVGNITAGGTGKTPVVQWLARRLAEMGQRPAVLLRGYKRPGIEPGDEELLLREALPGAVVYAQADRVAAGKAVLERHPEVDAIVLDDGFQHRRLARDFELVLIDATNPFGFGHVHPRGLLREPLAGLARADAFVLTRADQVSVEKRSDIEAALRGWNHRAPLYRARHVITGFMDGSESRPMTALEEKRFFVAAGIGNPASLNRQIESFAGECKGCRWFPDHHQYTSREVEHLLHEARNSGAEVLIVTEKDWVKIREHMKSAGAPRVWRTKLEIEFESGGQGLIELIQTRVEKSRMAQTPVP